MERFSEEKMGKVYNLIKQEFPDMNEVYISVIGDSISISEKKIFYCNMDEDKSLLDNEYRKYVE